MVSEPEVNGIELHPKIENLCSKLAQSYEQGCIGFTEDDSFKHYIEMSPSTLIQTDISLNDVFLQKDKVSIGPFKLESFSPLVKYELAAKLAFGVLQYHATPWLKKDWSHQDIYLAFYGDHKHLTTNAYIQQTFELRMNGTEDSDTAESEPDIEILVLQNELIFNVGVTLIELSLDQPLESFREPLGQVQTDDPTMNYIQLIRLSQIVLGDYL
jgi:hypothetical protein